MIEFKTSPTGESLMACSASLARADDSRFHTKAEWTALIAEMDDLAASRRTFDDKEAAKVWAGIRARTDTTARAKVEETPLHVESIDTEALYAQHNRASGGAK